MVKKRIKSSARGLTFSLSEAEGKNITVGMKYRYIVNMAEKTVDIIPDEENGTHMVSKKRTRGSVKPLFDLRGKDVRAMIKNADFLEIEVLESGVKVTAHAVKKAGVRLLKNKVVSITELLGRKTGEVVLSDCVLSAERIMLAAGAEHLSVLDSFASLYAGVSEKGEESRRLKKIYDVVSLFSGAGLFDKAWADTGRFRIVYANDFCRDVLETYRYNIGNVIECKDIRDVGAEELPFADVFSTSPCCQAYSNANRHNIDSAEGEEKRRLVEEVIRLVSERKPKVCVIENVPGMLTMEDGIHLAKVVEGLPEYEVTACVVKDHEVGGYSIRERAIIIASRIGRIELPSFKVLNPKTVRDALSKVTAEWYNYSDITVPNEETQKKMSFVPQGGNWMNIPPEYNSYKAKTHSNVMRRLVWDEPSITMSNFRKSNILHPEEDRILSVAEAGAIMGLDKRFRFVSKSLSAKQQMVANGVTQAIGRFVAGTVLHALDAAPVVG